MQEKELVIIYKLYLDNDQHGEFVDKYLFTVQEDENEYYFNLVSSLDNQMIIWNLDPGNVPDRLWNIDVLKVLRKKTKEYTSDYFINSILQNDDYKNPYELYRGLIPDSDFRENPEDSKEDLENKDKNEDKKYKEDFRDLITEADLESFEFDF